MTGFPSEQGGVLIFFCGLRYGKQDDEKDEHVFLCLDQLSGYSNVMTGRHTFFIAVSMSKHFNLIWAKKGLKR